MPLTDMFATAPGIFMWPGQLSMHIYHLHNNEILITSCVRWEGDIPVHQLQITRKAYNYSQNSRWLCNVGYPSETHFKIKSWEISFVHSIRFSCPIGLKLCARITAVLCAKFQNVWSTAAWVTTKQDFARFVFKMRIVAIQLAADIRSTQD